MEERLRLGGTGGARLQQPSDVAVRGRHGRFDVLDAGEVDRFVGIDVDGVLVLVVVTGFAAVVVFIPVDGRLRVDCDSGG